MRTLIVSTLVFAIQTAALAMTESDYQDHGIIREAVTSFLESKLRRQNLDFKIQFNNLDPRLKLPRCTNPLDIFYPPGSRPFGNVSIGVRCTAAKPWTIYTSVKVSVYRDVIVLTKAMKRGATITSSHIDKKRIELSRVHSQYLTEFSEVIGKTIRRPLASGMVLNMGILSEPKTIERGQQVILIAHANGMKIRMMGAALMDGIVGQRIRVRNISSKRIIEGTVISPGLVRIQF